MSHERLRELSLCQDDVVFVNPREARVFLEDYSI
jgi:hypothetical protein